MFARLFFLFEYNTLSSYYLGLNWITVVELAARLPLSLPSSLPPLPHLLQSLIQCLPSMFNDRCFLKPLTLGRQAPVKDLTDDTATATESTVEDCIELAKRAFALKNYEQAVEHYANALEVS